MCHTIFVEDARVEIGHQDDDAFAMVVPTDTDVMEPATKVKRPCTPSIDVIVAHSGLGEQRSAVQCRLCNIVRW